MGSYHVIFASLFANIFLFFSFIWPFNLMLCHCNNYTADVANMQANARPSHMELNCLPRILHVCKKFLVHTKNIHICSPREWWATLFIIFVRKLYWENMIKPIDSINNLEHMFSCMALVFRCAVALLIRVGQTPFTLSIFELWQHAWPAFSNIHRETLREHESQILNF